MRFAGKTPNTVPFSRYKEQLDDSMVKFCHSSTSYISISPPSPQSGWSVGYTAISRAHSCRLFLRRTLLRPVFSECIRVDGRPGARSCMCRQQTRGLRNSTCYLSHVKKLTNNNSNNNNTDLLEICWMTASTTTLVCRQQVYS